MLELTIDLCFSCKIICPWGTEGITGLDTELDVLHNTPVYQPAQVIDTLGAGDTFVAATIFSLSEDKSLKESIEFGSRVAGAKVGFYGYDQIRELFQK